MSYSIAWDIYDPIWNIGLKCLTFLQQFILALTVTIVDLPSIFGHVIK